MECFEDGIFERGDESVVPEEIFRHVVWGADGGAASGECIFEDGGDECAVLHEEIEEEGGIFEEVIEGDGMGWGIEESAAQEGAHGDGCCLIDTLHEDDGEGIDIDGERLFGLRVLRVVDV